MYQVRGEYPDYQRHDNKNSFALNPDQAFNPYTWSPPINWEGYVGGKKVKFVQTDSFAFSVDCFDWADFPKELEVAKHYIAEAIDDALRVMD